MSKTKVITKAVHKVQPPYVLAALFGDPRLEGGEVVGMNALQGKLTLIDHPDAQGVIVAPPKLFVLLAIPGMSGQGSVMVRHKPPTGPALPEIGMSGPLAGETIRTVFDFPVFPLVEGIHFFELRYADRVLTKVPLTVEIRRFVQ